MGRQAFTPMVSLGESVPIFEDIDNATLPTDVSGLSIGDGATIPAANRPSTITVSVVRHTVPETLVALASTAVQVFFRLTSRRFNGATSGPAAIDPVWILGETLINASNTADMELPYHQPVRVPAGVDGIAIAQLQAAPGGNITAWVDLQDGLI